MSLDRRRVADWEGFSERAAAWTSSHVQAKDSAGRRITIRQSRWPGETCDPPIEWLESGDSGHENGGLRP